MTRKTSAGIDHSDEHSPRKEEEGMQDKAIQLPDGSSTNSRQKNEDTLHQEARNGWIGHRMTNQPMLGFTESMLAVFYKTEVDDG